MWQDIIRQVEQGSSRVLQAVDWPQSSPDGQKDQDGQDKEAETPPEDDQVGASWLVSQQKHGSDRENGACTCPARRAPHETVLVWHVQSIPCTHCRSCNTGCKTSLGREEL